MKQRFSKLMMGLIAVVIVLAAGATQSIAWDVVIRDDCYRFFNLNAV